MKLDEQFKPVIALGKNRFNIWKILIANKDAKDLLVTFEDDDEKKYACIEFEKLLVLLYDETKAVRQATLEVIDAYSKKL